MSPRRWDFPCIWWLTGPVGCRWSATRRATVRWVKLSRRWSPRWPRRWCVARGTASGCARRRSAAGPSTTSRVAVTSAGVPPPSAVTGARRPSTGPVSVAGARPDVPACVWRTCLTPRAEEVAQIAGEQFGLLERREVAAVRHPRPARDGEVAFGEVARRLRHRRELVAEDGAGSASRRWPCTSRTVWCRGSPTAATSSTFQGSAPSPSRWSRPRRWKRCCGPAVWTRGRCRPGWTSAAPCGGRGRAARRVGR